MDRDAETTDRLAFAREQASEIPTEAGESFRISDLGIERGGLAITSIREALGDCWGELALVVANEHGDRETYSVKEGKPIYLSYVPDDNYDPEEMGPQTLGIRYSYQFMRTIGTDNPIRLVRWDDTRFTDVEDVVYP